MKRFKSSLGLTAATAVLAALGAGGALAAFPEKPVTVLISSSPGSGGDTIARTYQPFMEKCLGTTLVVVNKPGAGGALSHNELQRSAPDGYTIGNINLPNAVAQAIEKGAPPPWEHFDYVANMASSRVGLHVSPKSPWKTFKEFVDYAKKNPRQITLGLGGLGGDDHIFQLQAMKAAGIELTVVPMGDSATARAAFLGGHVAAFSTAAYEVLPYKDQIRSLWYAAEERSPLQPDVPTLKELGYNVVGGSNQIVGAPKGVPAEALAKLRGCYETVFKDPAFIAEANKRGIPLFWMSGPDTEKLAREQHQGLVELWKTSPWKQ